MTASASDKLLKPLERAVDAIMLALFFLLFFVGGYALLDAHIVGSSANIDEDVKSLAPTSVGASFSLDELKQINPEIVGWLTIDGTNIDYPVVQADNNSKYLTRDYRGDYGTAGAIFVDARNDAFRDDYTIIYGHRMDGGKMFGDIEKFSEQTFFNDHATGTLYTEDGAYSLEPIAYSVIDISDANVYRLDSYKIHSNDVILRHILQAARQTTPYIYHSGDKFILLSTCDRNSQNYRDVILLQMSKN